MPVTGTSKLRKGVASGYYPTLRVNVFNTSCPSAYLVVR
jgi:hypothetical protein